MSEIPIGTNKSDTSIQYVKAKYDLVVTMNTPHIEANETIKTISSTSGVTHMVDSTVIKRLRGSITFSNRAEEIIIHYMICAAIMYRNFSLVAIVDMYHFNTCDKSDMKNYQAFFGAISIVMRKE